MIDDFYGWLGGVAKPGDAYEYYRGYLARDREPYLRGVAPNDRQKEIDALGSGVYRAWELGQVTLVQKRYGLRCYGYLAIRRWRH